MSIEVSEIPDLAGTDVSSARDWYAALGRLDALWHPDDPADDLDLFTPEAAVKAGDAVRSLHAGSKSWPDPDFLYDLAGSAPFEVETLYPGRIVVDACVPGAGRTGYVALGGQDRPTFVVEDMGRFVALQPLEDGPTSAVKRWMVSPVDGAQFGTGGVIDVRRASLDAGAGTVVDLGGLKGKAAYDALGLAVEACAGADAAAPSR